MGDQSPKNKNQSIQLRYFTEHILYVILPELDEFHRNNYVCVTCLTSNRQRLMKTTNIWNFNFLLVSILVLSSAMCMRSFLQKTSPPVLRIVNQIHKVNYYVTSILYKEFWFNNFW
jgi:hypothetical protein